MLIFKKKNLIKFGLNLNIKNLSKYKFLNKLILSNKLFFSIFDLKLLIYKLLSFYTFNNLYIKNLKNTRTLLFVDGSLNKRTQTINKKYLLQYNYFYINKNNWLPIFEKNLQIKKINFLIFWNYNSFFFKINPFFLNIPFFFFFQKPPKLLKNIKWKFFNNANFIFSNYNTEINYFFWLCTINHLILTN